MLKSNVMQNGEYKKLLDRKTNALRLKTSRYSVLKERRKIAEIVNLTNDSIIETVVKKTTLNKNKQSNSSRSLLLQQWKLKKEQLKVQDSKKKAKAKFVVKHVEYKDNIFADPEKENIDVKLLNQKKVNQKASQFILKEKNSNVNQIYRKPADVSSVRPVEANIKSMKYAVAKTKESCCRNEPKNFQRSLENITSTTKGSSKQNLTSVIGKTTTEPMKQINNDKNSALSELFSSKSITEKFKELSFEDLQSSANFFTESQTFVVGPFSFKPPVGLSGLNFDFNLDVSSKDVLVHKPPDVENSKLSENKSTETFEKLEKAKICSVNHAASLRRSERVIATNSPVHTKGLIPVNGTIKTPLSLFKESEGISQRMLVSSPSISKRNISPNPKNFFSMKEDPVAQRIDSPLCKKSDPNPIVLDSVEHFSKLVTAEEATFKKSIDKWNKILEDGSAPEQVHGDIMAAIGQAQLFTHKRFRQFKELIELHKDKNAEKVALASDLDGFWEMIYFQVKDVHKRFVELDLLQQNNWRQSEEKAKPDVRKKKHVVKKIVESNVLNKDKKRVDFKQFRQQMMLKNLENKGKEDIVNESLPSTFKSCRSLPVLSKDEYVKSDPALVAANEEFSADSLEEASPDKHLVTGKGNVTPFSNLRRSTRKTPSKYRFVEFACQKEMTPKNVACKLFNDNIVPGFDGSIQTTSEFTKYLSKSIPLEDASMKCDLLSSFNEAEPEVVPLPKHIDDLMMFSPLHF